MSGAASVLMSSSLPPIGVPFSLGSNSGTTSLSMTTGADAPAASIIAGSVVILTGGSIPTITSITDNATGGSNTYIVDGGTLLNVGLSNSILYSFYCQNTPHDLPNGGVITVNFGVAGTECEIAAVACSGVGPVSVNPSGVSSSGASTGTLPSQPQIVFGFGGGAGSNVTYTEQSPFTNVLVGFDGTGLYAAVSYDSVTSTASVTYNPTTNASLGWANKVTSFT